MSSVCCLDLCSVSHTYHQQKEPKLSRARQIPEWSQYDAEIARFARQLVKDGKIRSTALGAEVDALAGEKSTISAEGVTVEDTVLEEVPVEAPHDEL
jgi:UDP-glucose:glycoprotein glucosyltransferase